MSRSSGERVRYDAVEGRQLLPGRRAADPDRAGQPVAVVAVDRLAELEHHEVGDVDGQRDRPHAGQLDPARQPAGGRRGRVEAGDGAGDEDRAAGGIVDLDRVARIVRRRDVALRGVAEGGPAPVDGVLQRRLAGDAAQRQRVGAVGVDLELDDLVAQVEHVEGVVAGLAGVGGQHDDAFVVVAEAELPGRADHARREVAVGLARGDREVPGQHGAGQDADDEVAGREVVGAADDALGLAGAVGVTDVDGAPVDGLAVLLRLGLHREHTADDQRAGDVVTGALDRLDPQPEVGQRVGELLQVEVVGEVDVVADPRHGGTHGVRAPFRRRTRSGRRPRRSRAGRRRRSRT